MNQDNPLITTELLRKIGNDGVRRLEAYEALQKAVIDYVTQYLPEGKKIKIVHKFDEFKRNYLE
jgi:hypothetical protein